MHKMLPAWFVQRMAEGGWSFGLLLTTGEIMCITGIENVHQDANGGIWLDVLDERCPERD